jgi:PAS domain-containing protein
VETSPTPRSLPDLSTRRRTGIEPARELVAPSSVLKTAGPTRNPDASTVEDSGAGSMAPLVYGRVVTEPAPQKQRHIALILAKDLAANVASAMLLVDREGDLVFFNEAAERILGRPYAEAQMSTAELAKTFKPVGVDGAPIPIEGLPMAHAFRDGVPTHGHMRIEAVDGHVRDLEVVAVPLFAQPDNLVGGVAVFWERAEWF